MRVPLLRADKAHRIREGQQAILPQLPAGYVRLKDANIGSVAFKKAKVFNSIQVPIGFS